jgi:hypothetical protein
MQRSNHARERGFPGSDRKACKRDTVDCDPRLLRGRETLRVFRRKVDDEADHGDGFMGQPADAEPTHLDETGEHRGRTHQQPAGHRFDLGAIVGNEPRKPQRPARGGNQLEGEARLAGTGRAADENGARADEHGRGVDGRWHIGRRHGGDLL